MKQLKVAILLFFCVFVYNCLERFICPTWGLSPCSSLFNSLLSLRSSCQSRGSSCRRWKCGYRSTGTSLTSWPSSSSPLGWCFAYKTRRWWATGESFTASISFIGTYDCLISSEWTNTWVHTSWWLARWWGRLIDRFNNELWQQFEITHVDV